MTAEAVRAVDALWRGGDLAGALKRARQAMRPRPRPPGREPRPGGCRALDAVLAAMGRDLAGKLPQPGELAGDWVLASQLLEMGGHTGVLADLSRAVHPLGGVVVTLEGHKADQLTRAAIRRAGVEPVVAVRGNHAAQRLEQALAVWAGSAPRRVLLLHHPNDAVAVVAAAVVQAWGSEVVLLHHADWTASTGLFLPGVRVVDFTPRAAAFSRFVLGHETDYLPLTCAPDGARHAGGWRGAGRLVTATTGGVAKFPPEAQPSLEAVVALAMGRGGAHVHIGPMEVARAEALRRLAGKDFHHLPGVRDIREALVGHGVDFLLHSWPMGGARAAVEVMAAGIPAVWQAPTADLGTLRAQMHYPGAVVWRDLDGLGRILDEAGADWLDAQGRAARRHWEAHHHPDRWRRYFQTGKGAEPLPTHWTAARAREIWGGREEPAEEEN